MMPSLQSGRTGRRTPIRFDPRRTGIQRPGLAFGLVLVLALLFVSEGCGYKAGWLMEDVAPGARTIAVTIPGNQTFRRDLEIAFGRELALRIANATPWALDEPERADLLLEGEITRVQERVLSEDRVDDVFESSVTITVFFRFFDQRSGRKLREFTVNDRAEFVLSRGESLSSAQAEAFTDLTDKVVFSLEDSF